MTDLHDLGVMPSQAELLQADFPEWIIWRDIDGSGRHGDWGAQHATDAGRVLYASDIPALRQLLIKSTPR